MSKDRVGGFRHRTPAGEELPARARPRTRSSARRLLGSTFAIGLLLAGCGGGGGSAGTSTDTNPGADPGTGPGAGPGTANNGAGGDVPPNETVDRTRLRWTSVRDTTPYGGGLEAVKLLTPSDWTVRGSMSWDVLLRNGGVSRDYSVISPDTLRGIEFLPERPYFWNESIAQLTPIGEVYLFRGAEVRPPLSALQYLSQIALPQLPYEGVTMGAFEQMPAVTTSLQGLFGGRADAARARITFRANGIDFEGEVHAWLAYLDEFDPASGPFTTWKADRAFLIYAPVGEIDAALAFLYPLVVSETINPAWAEVPFVVERSRIAQNAQVLAQNAEFAEFLRQQSAQTFDLIDQTFRNANAANDRIFDAYDQYLRGADTWQDPTVGPVELPSGFDQVWANPATGEYLMLNDPSFDPNRTLNGNWTLLPRG